SLSLNSASDKTSYVWNPILFDGKANLNKIADGTVNTVMFTERYASCSGSPNLWAGVTAVIPGTTVEADNFPNATTLAQFEDFVLAKTLGIKPEACAPAAISPPHPGGALLLMGDGSVRNMGPQTGRARIVKPPLSEFPIPPGSKVGYTNFT